MYQEDILDVDTKTTAVDYYYDFTNRSYENRTEFDFCRSDSNETYLNITCEVPIEYAIPMYGYIAPVLLVSTTVANTLIVIVLSRRDMRTPTNIVLMSMAICDMLTLLFPSPWLFYLYTFGNHNKPLYPLSACYCWHIMNEIIPAMFHSASIWLTLALAVQRYIYVCHAAVARTWCTMPRVIKTLIIIYIAAFLHQLPRFFETVYVSKQVVWNNASEHVCKREIAAWINRYLSIDGYYMTYFVFRILFVNIIPCITLVVLNVLLFRALRRAQNKRRKLFKENRKNECKKLRDSNCTTLMLIVVVTVFLLVEIPVALVTLLHIISNIGYNFLDYHMANSLVLVTNFFIIVSYPINFAIYCGMSRQFRETFKELFVANKFVTRTNNGSTRYTLVNSPRTCTNETVL